MLQEESKDTRRRKGQKNKDGKGENKRKSIKQKKGRKKERRFAHMVSPSFRNVCHGSFRMLELGFFICVINLCI